AVGVGWQHVGALGAAGPLHERFDERGGRQESLGDLGADVQVEIQCDLVVAAASGVQQAGDGSECGGEVGLDRHVHVLLFGEGERAGVRVLRDGQKVGPDGGGVLLDRKSTRLNSSHVKISY